MGDVSANEKLKYPKSVFFIVTNEFCERFTFYGLRTVLSLYFATNLQYSEDEATVRYHTFVMLCYFFPLIGAIIADTWLGKFKTILYLSIIYCGGSILLSVASSRFGAEDGQRYNLEVVLSFLGLLCIAIGTGGIKPCVSSFGGDQFKVPEQRLQLAQFFSIFYFAINSGSLISTYITPIFRQDVQCFGQKMCYPLAFGVPAIFMVVALVVFVSGKKMYKMVPPKGNVMVQVCACIASAISGRWNRTGSAQGMRWIDYANQNKYDKELRDDVVAVLKVLVLSLPIPVFWALYDQQGSRWTFQGLHMDGRLGSFVIKPDQMQVVNPILILVLLPIMEMGVYPGLARFKLLRKPLQRMVTGGVLASIAFFVSAFLEHRIEASYPVLPREDLAQIRIFNVGPYPLGITSDRFSPVVLPEMEMHAELALRTVSPTPLKLQVMGGYQTGEFHIPLKSHSAQSVYLFNDNGTVTLIRAPIAETLTKTSDVDPVVRFVCSFADGQAHNIQLRNRKGIVTSYSVSPGTKCSVSKDITRVVTDKYDLLLDNNVVLGNVFLDVSGTYSLLISDSMTKLVADSDKTGPISILWQLPQLIIISLAEVMFSVTGLEFFYTQASINMKSVLSSVWLLTTAFGNVIVMIIAEAKIFESMVWEFILFSCLMLVDIAFFLILTIRYKYRDEISNANALGTVNASAAETVNVNATPEKTGNQNPDVAGKK